MKFMLDTNICIHIIRQKPPSIIARFHDFAPQDLCISSVTLAELEYGVEKSAFPEKNRLALAMFLAGITVLPFDHAAAAEYGRIRARLEKTGMPIGSNDLLIAAHARSLGLPIVTNNAREFLRAEGLTVENWVSSV